MNLISPYLPGEIMRDDKQGRVLNLDELFGGTSTPIVVNWQGVRYALRRPEEMGPRDLVTYDRLNRLLNEMSAPQPPPSPLAPLPEGEGSFDEARAKAWERAIDEMLRLIGPELLTIDPPLPFTAKTRVLQFYTEALTPEAPADEKKAPPTGATSSPD